MLSHSCGLWLSGLQIHAHPAGPGDLYGFIPGLHVLGVFPSMGPNILKLCLTRIPWVLQSQEQHAEVLHPAESFHIASIEYRNCSMHLNMQLNV